MAMQTRRRQLEEWESLPNGCFISGCLYDDMDTRGPIFTRDGGVHKACVPHWEAVYRILGEQADIQQNGDAMIVTFKTQKADK